MKLESSRRSKRKEAKENHATSFSMFDVFYVVIDEVKYEHIFINHKDGVVHSVLKTTLCFVGRIILLQPVWKSPKKSQVRTKNIFNFYVISLSKNTQKIPEKYKKMFGKIGKKIWKKLKIRTKI